MTHRFKRGALGVASTLALLAACKGESITSVDTVAGTPPTVDIVAVNGVSGSVDIAQPLAITLSAAGERAIRTLRLTVTSQGRRLGGLDTSFATPQAVVNSLPITVPLTGVVAGEQLVVVALARDVRNMESVDTLRLVATVNTATPPGGGGAPSVGPVVRLDSPADTVGIWPGRSIVLRYTAVDTDGIRIVSDTIRGAGFSPITSSFQTSGADLPDTVTRSRVVEIPASAVLDSTITIVVVAIDANSAVGQPVRRRLTVRTQPADTAPPFVYQAVGARLEDSSTIVVRAEDVSPIRMLGYILRDSAGTVIGRDSIIRAVGARRTIDSAVFTLRFPASARGQVASVSSFAADTVAISGRSNRGVSVAEGARLPESDETRARRDFTLLVFGRTVALPAGSRGADIAVDTVSGRRVVYVSNLLKNRLDVIDYTTLRSLVPVSVGSEPWGMDLDPATGQLLVANSGGTNISVVSLVTRSETSRIKTPNTRLWNVIEASDASGLTRYTVKVFDYSDRPQYVGKSALGFVYFSTRPTASAPAGTIRRFAPGRERELNQLWQYGAEGKPNEFTIVDADAVVVIPGANETDSDDLIVYDHRAGETDAATIAVRDSSLARIIPAIRALGGDASAPNVSTESLALTDTTFLAVGGDRNWLAFGEGNTASAAGRVFLFSDTVIAGVTTLRASPGISVGDLVDNASEPVFGLALNRNSSGVAVQGTDAFYADVQNDYRFQLRLQGRYATPGGTGRGIAYHPLNDGTQGTPANRTSFVATATPLIEIVDSYFYRLRGQLPVKATLYGPIRAVLPTPAEQAAGVAVKLFGLTSAGLVVIDVRTADLDNTPAGALRR